MTYKIQYSKEAIKDLYKLDRDCQTKVIKAIKKVSTNPLANSEGGYGKPLGKKGNTNLTGFLKIKLKKEGVRVVYKIIKLKSVMYIIVIAARADNEVYELANKRK